MKTILNRLSLEHSIAANRMKVLVGMQLLLEDGDYNTDYFLICSEDVLEEIKPWLTNIGLVYNQRSEEHTSELQSPDHLVCRLLLEKKKLR